MTPKFKPGDRVRIVCENRDAELPEDSNAENLGSHKIPIGTECTIPEDMEDDEDDYDGYDNSWLIKGGGYHAWVHEGALEYAVAPVTPDEEAEALESIRKALG